MELLMVVLSMYAVLDMYQLLIFLSAMAITDPIWFGGTFTLHIQTHTLRWEKARRRLKAIS